jgi:hypothetical protein
MVVLSVAVVVLVAAVSVVVAIATSEVVVVPKYLGYEGLEIYRTDKEVYVPYSLNVLTSIILATNV